MTVCWFSLAISLATRGRKDLEYVRVDEAMSCENSQAIHNTPIGLDLESLFKVSTKESISVY